MKNFVRLSVLLWLYLSTSLLCNKSFGQAPNYTWVKQLEGYQSYPFQIEVDKSGNSIIMGMFGESISFGDTTLLSNFYYEYFIAKLDPSGNFLWAKKAGTSSAQFRKLAIDKQGNCWLTGEFTGTMHFDSITLSSSQANGFVAKFDSDGNTICARKGIGITGTAITTDTAGNAYVAGEGIITINSAPYGNLFIAKFDAQGEAAWAHQATAASNNYTSINDLITDGQGNIYLAGSIDGNVSFDSIMLTVNGGTTGALSAKLNEQTGWMWAKSSNGANNSQNFASALIIDANKNIYITGSIGSYSYPGQLTVYFDSVSLTTVGKDDLFIAKYDSAGNILWAKSYGGLEGDTAWDIAIDSNDNPVVTGHFQGNIFLGTHFLSSWQTDMFIFKFTPEGIIDWAKQSSMSDFAWGSSLAIDSHDAIYVVGSFNGTMILGDSMFFNFNYDDSFIAKLSHTPLATSELPFSSTLSAYPNPFTTSFQISLTGTAPAMATLTDMLGRQVHRQVIAVGSTTATVNPPANLPSGTYVLQVQEGENVRQVRAVRK